MTTPTKNADVSASARALLPGQYQDATTLKTFCDALTGRIQDIEDAAWQLLTERFLSNARGQNLDTIGEHVGLTRQGLTDEMYRVWLYIQIAINASQGDPERLLDITKRIGRSTFVHYLCKFPGVALLYSHVVQAWDLLSKVQRAATGGVRVVQTGWTDANVFVLGADHDAAGVQCGDDLAYGSGLGEVSSL